MRLGGRIRTYFLAGLVVCAPIAITVWLVWWFVSLFDGWLKPLIPSTYNPDHYLPFSVPGVGLVFALVGITLIGALAANLVGRTLIGYWEFFLGRMPVVRSVYKAVKQIFQTAVAQSGSNFRQVALIEWPRKGLYAIAFVSREMDSAEIGLPGGERLWSVFMPTTPNPTSGFLLFMPADQLRILDITVEEGAKIVISAGLVTRQHGTPAGSVPTIDEDTARKLLEEARAGRPLAEATPVEEAVAAVESAKPERSRSKRASIPRRVPRKSEAEP